MCGPTGVSDWIRRIRNRCDAVHSDLQNPFRDLADRFAQVLTDVRSATIADLTSVLSRWLLDEIGRANSCSYEELADLLTDALEQIGVEFTAVPWIHKSLKDACFVFRLGERDIYVSLPRESAP